MALRERMVSAEGFRHCLCEHCGMVEDWCLLVEVEIVDDEEDEVEGMSLDAICFGCFRIPNIRDEASTAR